MHLFTFSMFSSNWVGGYFSIKSFQPLLISASKFLLVKWYNGYHLEEKWCEIWYSSLKTFEYFRLQFFCIEALGFVDDKLKFTSSQCPSQNLQSRGNWGPVCNPKNPNISIKILHTVHYKFLSCWQGEFVSQSRASLAGDHFLYSHN